MRSRERTSECGHNDIQEFEIAHIGILGGKEENIGGRGGVWSKKDESRDPSDFAVAGVWRTHRYRSNINCFRNFFPERGGLENSLGHFPRSHRLHNSIIGHFLPRLPTQIYAAMSSNNASLDAASTDRKARLAKLAALKRKQPEPDTLPDDAPAGEDEAEQATPDVTTSYLSGRNYDAEMRGPKLGFEQGPQEGQVTLEEQAADIANAVKEQSKQADDADQPIDLFKLQPKKPNWDLRRDLDEKLKTLNVRTENAIARLARQRIENAQRAAKERGAGSKDQEGEEVGIEGEMLVEGIHVREQEEDKDEDTI